eukprot:TRINITY_DN689_c7_g1_i1.p1 TRINITY_DN689_c7_g1~~TRINITY_DN689_c7_g1_i1.p1  ORF type:complete len:387 (-),score=85.16 TRINITY_DN689_c7_g1_i1:2-1138(-)
MENNQLRVLEFYSGIGGMHTSLNLAVPGSTVLSAFDINPNANLVYEENYGSKVDQRNLETIKLEYFNKYNANMWLMSPPCQPYTQQKTAKQLDTKDPRAKSFLHLLNLLSVLENKPKYILLENVKGFELSDARRLLVETISNNGYNFQEFHLTPTQFGIPNSRMRYYFLAKLNENFSSPENNGKLLQFIPFSEYFQCNNDNNDNNNNNTIWADGSNIVPKYNPKLLADYCEPLMSVEEYLVPEEIVRKMGRVMDLVDIQKDNHSCCFTKAYGKYFEGTGSLVLLNGSQSNDDDKSNNKEDGDVHRNSDNDNNNNTTSITTQKLRYFTPKEIALIHGFPQSFRFTPKLSNRQHYQLLGNSLNCVVVSQLIKYLIKVPLS